MSHGFRRRPLALHLYTPKSSSPHLRHAIIPVRCVMDAEKLILILQYELRGHNFDTFVDNPPSVAHGGNGVVVPGCPKCRARLYTMDGYNTHLTQDVVPRQNTKRFEQMLSLRRLGFSISSWQHVGSWSFAFVMLLGNAHWVERGRALLQQLRDFVDGGSCYAAARS